MDEVDYRLLELLYEDGRAKLVRLAERLGLTHASVKERISKLISRGILRIQGNVNLQKLGVRTALVLLEIDDPANLERAVEEFSECTKVLMVGLTSGEYNLFILLGGVDIAEFRDYIENVVRRRFRARKIYVSFGEIAKPAFYPALLGKSTNCPFSECRARREEACLGVQPWSYSE